MYVENFYHFDINFSKGEKFGSGVPIVGMASALLLYGRQSRKFSFLQSMCALEMWKSGADKKVF